MKKFIIAALFCFLSRQGSAQSTPWVTAYYAGWSQGWSDNGVLPAEQIDYSAVTHIIHFGLDVHADGTLDDQANSVHADNAKAVIAAAHAAGKKILITVGGWNTADGFRAATSVLALPAFVTTLVNFIKHRGYDGIDIDWEPLAQSDAAQFQALASALRTALDLITPRPLLTTATGSGASSIILPVADKFDQINLMTYDMSGAWPGWVTWFNAPIYNGGFRFPSTGGLVPCADDAVNEFIAAGIPKNKLSIGIDFYGYVWNGGSGTSTGGAALPQQTWTSAPWVSPNVPYYTLMQQYYKPEYYRWDSTAQAAYLSIDNPGSADDKFISYDNEMSVKAKLDYVKQKGLGGVIIWELGGGMLPAQFANRDRLLQTVKMGYQNKPVTPPSPSSFSPQHFTEGVSTQPTLKWNATTNTSWYRVQLSADSTFTAPAFDEQWLIDTLFAPSILLPQTNYFWRVQSSNAYAASSWSSTERFKTANDTLVPPWWEYVSNTGNNATLFIASSVNPTIENRPLEFGDLIGVFFRRDNAQVCAGYSRWEPGTNMAITAWGDNQLTDVKDGCAKGDTIFIRIYRRATGKEYTTNVHYTSGTTIATYTANGIYTVQTLTAIPNVVQNISLGAGWNMTSSYIVPNDSSLQSLLASIAPDVALIKDGSGNVFWPDSNTAEIKFWTVLQGYQIYMRSAGTLTITGAPVTPESTAIALSTGWNLIAYLRTTPMSPDAALAGINSQLVLMKNNDGDVYWPQFSINTLGTMNPGEGYQVYVTKNVGLYYPANNIGNSAGGIAGTRDIQPRERTDAAASHYPFAEIKTGSNAILLLESSALKEGDEVAVRSGSGLVGSGTVHAGKCALTIWGNDSLTPGIRGAKEGEELSLTRWDAQLNKEYRLDLTSLTNGITNQSVPLPFRYHAESVLIGQAKIVPMSFSLEQNYPNPFNPSTTIEYDVPQTAKIVLEVFNMLGQRVAMLVNQTQAAGHYSVVFKNERVASGTYFYRL
ncbi:MAG: T9SS type A sorting domain-containing protein, partial [Bacteroidota bacterium]|nr:T9SS type A sorting domain-containing protein [Bacteroidota bacterium]